MRVVHLSTSDSQRRRRTGGLPPAHRPAPARVSSRPCSSMNARPTTRTSSGSVRRRTPSAACAGRVRRSAIARDAARYPNRPPSLDWFSDDRTPLRRHARRPTPAVRRHQPPLGRRVRRLRGLLPRRRAARRAAGLAPGRHERLHRRLPLRRPLRQIHAAVRRLPPARLHRPETTSRARSGCASNGALATSPTTGSTSSAPAAGSPARRSEAR